MKHRRDLRSQLRCVRKSLPLHVNFINYLCLRSFCIYVGWRARDYSFIIPQCQHINQFHAPTKFHPHELGQLRRFFAREALRGRGPSRPSRILSPRERAVHVPETMNLRVSGVDNGRCGTPL